MNKRVLEALKRSRYKVVTDSRELDEIYRLRYNCYRAEQSIPENETGMMTDAFDRTEPAPIDSSNTPTYFSPDKHADGAKRITHRTAHSCTNAHSNRATNSQPNFHSKWCTNSFTDESPKH